LVVNMALIQCMNVSKEYVGEGVKTRALFDVSLSIENGEFVSIMGPSGSGKSTLMHILGLLDRPTSGTYIFNGSNANTFNEDDLARIRNQNIGFVFQAFNLLPRTTVFENVELPLLYDMYSKNLHRSWDIRGIFGIRGHLYEQKVTDALRAVGMEHRMLHTSGQLSGGEKQRVAMARALVNNPDIVFADEPTGNLDSRSGLQVMKILQKLNEEGKTVILVTHETYTAEHAKRIIRMYDGRIVGDEKIISRRNASQERELLK